eukprot:1182711-Prorocentrum_minimum.AAC.1
MGSELCWYLAARARLWNPRFREDARAHADGPLVYLLLNLILNLTKTLLNLTQDAWGGICFEFMKWRETGTFILKAFDETQVLLDDQIVKTQSMRSSPYIGAFEEQVKAWNSKLSLIQEIMDEWMKCQGGWLYLEPIFGSEDIMQQMPAEGRYILTTDQSDVGRAGVFSRRTNRDGPFAFSQRFVVRTQDLTKPRLVTRERFQVPRRGMIGWVEEYSVDTGT